MGNLKTVVRTATPAKNCAIVILIFWKGHSKAENVAETDHGYESLK